MKRILVLMLLITSCKARQGFDYEMRAYETAPSPLELPEQDRTFDHEINDLVREFEQAANENGYPLEPMTIYSKKEDLQSSGAHIIGQCRFYGSERLVVIDSQFWKTASAYDKRSLVFHELGHCYLNRPHRVFYYVGQNASYDDAFIPNWDFSTHQHWPISLMHRSLVREAKFKAEYDYYIRELFDERTIQMYQDNGVINCQGDY